MCVRACVHALVCACMHACVYVLVRVCVCGNEKTEKYMSVVMEGVCVCVCVCVRACVHVDESQKRREGSGK